MSARRLLEHLVCAPGHVTTALRGAALLWPMHLERSALNSFHVALHALRRMLEPGLPARAESGFVVRQGRTYRLRTERLACDLSDFMRLLSVARDATHGDDIGHLEIALRLWRLGFMQPSAERFVRDKRAELRLAVVEALERAGDRRAAAGDVTPATWAYRQLLDVEPLREDIWARVAELYAATGDDRSAVAALATCERQLRSAAIQPSGLIRDLQSRLGMERAVRPDRGRPVRTIARSQPPMRSG